MRYFTVCFIHKNTFACVLNCFNRVCLCETLWTVEYQATLFKGFSRQEHWSGPPLPSPMHEREK